MPRTTGDFAVISNREYWTTAEGRKLYPDQFEDDHLKNTIAMLHRKSRSHRLEKARQQCESVYTGRHPHINTEQYYRHFRRDMDRFLDPSISDTEWLKNNSKIYGLLLDEAKHREIHVDIDTESTTTVQTTINAERRTVGSRFRYIVQGNTDSMPSVRRNTSTTPRRVQLWA